MVTKEQLKNEAEALRFAGYNAKADFKGFGIIINEINKEEFEKLESYYFEKYQISLGRI